MSSKELEEFKKVLDTATDNLHKINRNFVDIIKLTKQELTEELFEEVARRFYYIVSFIPFLQSFGEVGLPIIRLRENKDCLPFTSEADISYHPDETKVSVGRFNRRYEPVFYGALPVDDPGIKQLETAARECCKELVDDSKVLPERVFTGGVWRVKERLKLLSLCLDPAHLRHNRSLLNNFNNYITDLKKYAPAKTANLILKITRFLSIYSSESPANPHDALKVYFTMNAFRSAIEQYYDNVMNFPIDGIIYPSAMTGSAGLNIIMPPTTIDKLTLDKIYMFKFSLNNRKYTITKCANPVTPINNKFDFKDYKFNK